MKIPEEKEYYVQDESIVPYEEGESSYVHTEEDRKNMRQLLEKYGLLDDENEEDKEK